MIKRCHTRHEVLVGLCSKSTYSLSDGKQVNNDVSYELISPELSGADKVERLQVVISGGVPKLPAGIGEAMAKTMVDCLKDWNIKDCV